MRLRLRLRLRLFPQTDTSWSRRRGGRACPGRVSVGSRQAGPTPRLFPGCRVTRPSCHVPCGVHSEPPVCSHSEKPRGSCASGRASSSDHRPASSRSRRANLRKSPDFSCCFVCKWRYVCSLSPRCHTVRNRCQRGDKQTFCTTRRSAGLTGAWS